MPDEQQSVKEKRITLLRANDARKMKRDALIKLKQAVLLHAGFDWVLGALCGVPIVEHKPAHRSLSFLSRQHFRF